MRILLIIMVAVLANPSIETNNCRIIPSKGLGEIVIGQSTLEDVKKEFGDKKVQKTWVKASEAELLGRFEYYLKYDSIATFSTITVERNKEVIYKITITPESKCKTRKGNGIGSSYQDVIDEFGRPSLFYFYKDIGTSKMKLSYQNMDVVMGGRDTLSNYVEEIIIW